MFRCQGVKCAKSEIYFTQEGFIMTFGEKLKFLRLKEKMSQEELGLAIGVNKRSVINYETGKSFPRDTGVYGKIAKIFNVTTDYLLSEKEEFIAKAYAEGGVKGRKQAEALAAEVGSLFAGGRLSEVDKDAVFQAIQEAYWFAKSENKKYASKKRKS